MILVRLAELTLKSKFVRKQMRDKIIGFIKNIAKKEEVKIENIEIEGGRIFIESSNDEKLARKIRYLSGIASVSVAVKCKNDIEEIVKCIVKNFSKKIENRKINVEVRKVKKIEKSKLEIRDEIVKKLKEKVNFTFSYKDFDYCIYIEMREKFSLIFDNIFKGLYGIPYGFEGKAIVLFSGGTDSFLATLKAISRGLEIIPVFFDLGHFWSEEAKQRFFDSLKEIKKFIPKKLKYYIVNIEKFHETINPGRERCIACKLLMHYVAKKIAKKENAKAIVTGESVGQVASQTLENLYFFDINTCYLKIRPLVCYNKNDIVNELYSIAKSFDISFEKINKDVGKCLLAPKKPKIKPKNITLDIVKKFEKLIKIEKFLLQ